jgi:hypothetical protein
MAAYKILVGKLEEKRPLERHGRWWEDDIRMDLRGMGGKVWTAQDTDQWQALVDIVMNLWVP